MFKNAHNYAFSFTRRDVFVLGVATVAINMPTYSCARTCYISYIYIFIYFKLAGSKDSSPTWFRCWWGTWALDLCLVIEEILEKSISTSQTRTWVRGFARDPIHFKLGIHKGSHSTY